MCPVIDARSFPEKAEPVFRILRIRCGIYADVPENGPDHNAASQTAASQEPEERSARGTLRVRCRASSANQLWSQGFFVRHVGGLPVVLRPGYCRLLQALAVECENQPGFTKIVKLR